MIFKGYIYFMNTPHCPQFKSKNTVPIVYGLIDDFGQEKDKRSTTSLTSFDNKRRTREVQHPLLALI